MSSLLQRLKRSLTRPFRIKRPFTSSGDYWEQRYKDSGHSGSGSYGELAAFKAEILNAFVKEHGIQTVMEHGCGDGNQLQLAQYPQYTGYDVSPTILDACRAKFAGDATKQFKHIDDYDGTQADLSMSLDVIYHLVEDEVFAAHMQRLFESSKRFAVVYSSNQDEAYTPGSHVRNRRFTDWVERSGVPFKQVQVIPNRFPFEGDTKTGSHADFFIYQRLTEGA